MALAVAPTRSCVASIPETWALSAYELIKEEPILDCCDDGGSNTGNAELTAEEPDRDSDLDSIRPDFVDLSAVSDGALNISANQEDGSGHVVL